MASRIKSLSDDSTVLAYMLNKTLKQFCYSEICILLSPKKTWPVAQACEQPSALLDKLKTPADLQNTPLLHPVLCNETWNNILTHLGVERAANHTDMKIQDAATMRRATIAGLGVGLLSTIEAEEDIKSGALVLPFGLGIIATMPREQMPGFYLVLPKAHKGVKLFAAFCKQVESEDWSKPWASVYCQCSVFSGLEQAAKGAA